MPPHAGALSGCGTSRSGKGPCRAHPQHRFRQLPAGRRSAQVDRMSMRIPCKAHAVPQRRSGALRAPLPRQLYQVTGKGYPREISRRYLPPRSSRRQTRLPATTLWGEEHCVFPDVRCWPRKQLRAAVGIARSTISRPRHRSLVRYDRTAWAVRARIMLRATTRHAARARSRIRWFARASAPSEHKATLRQRLSTYIPPVVHYLLRLAVDGVRLQRRLHGNFAALLWLGGKVGLTLGRWFLYPFRRAIQRVAQALLARVIESRIGGLGDGFARSLRRRRWCLCPHLLPRRTRNGRPGARLKTAVRLVFLRLE